MDDEAAIAHIGRVVGVERDVVVDVHRREARNRGNVAMLAGEITHLARLGLARIARRALTAILWVEMIASRVAAAIGRNRILVDVVHCSRVSISSYNRRERGERDWLLTERATILRSTIDVEREEGANRGVCRRLSGALSNDALRTTLREDRNVVSRRRIIGNEGSWGRRHGARGGDHSHRDHRGVWSWRRLDGDEGNDCRDEERSAHVDLCRL